MNDPVNSFLAYLFITDKYYFDTFGVFKMDFSTATPKYVYTTLSMSPESAFSVTYLFRFSLTDPNDFLFAGKAEILADGTNTQAFPTGYGYVMMAKTNDSNKNSFSFPFGYSLSLPNTCTVNFVPTTGFTINGGDNAGIDLFTPIP